MLGSVGIFLKLRAEGRSCWEWSLCR